MFTLIDGEAKNMAYPDTFEIPTIEERQAIKPGDTVKLGFLAEDEEIGGERMWVTVKRVEKEKDYYLGTLSNTPFEMKMKHGDHVSFERKNILSIWEGEVE